jgi:hypothetical protein
MVWATCWAIFPQTHLVTLRRSCRLHDSFLTFFTVSDNSINILGGLSSFGHDGHWGHFGAGKVNNIFV